MIAVFSRRHEGPFWVKWASRFIVASALFLTAGLSGCGPSSELTMPPVTLVGPQVPTATLVQPSATPSPMETPSPTATLLPSPEPSAASPSATPGSTTVAKRQGATLTILHTNDVMGETAPCG